MMNFKKVALAATCTAMLGGVSGVVTTANAANWTMLQGTEPADAAPRAKVWGFIETSYQKDNSDVNAFVGTPGNNFSLVPPKLIGPDLESQSGFNVRRARIGVRGQGMPLDGNVNYFILAELGNNAITHGNGSAVSLTDASITFNHIDGARIRVGAFKVPTFEEGYQAIHVFDYINFSEVANQMMLERYPNKSATVNRNNTADFAFTDGNNESAYNRFNQPVGAFRDVGVQVFDSFKAGGWEHTYAVMLGNGNGVNFSDNDDNQDTHLYWSSEKVFGGKGPFRKGMKFFAWSQSGTRTLYNPATAPIFDAEASGKQEYDRKRSGIGFKMIKDNYRVTAEYLKGDGMIFLGPDNPSFTITSPTNGGGTYAVLADGRKGKADGFYVEGGYRFAGTKWELDARYDVYNRLTNATKAAPAPCAFEFKFETITLGAQYHVNKKTRLTLNVANRDFDAVNCNAPSAGGNPNNNLHTVGQRVGVQVRHIF